jgi:GST-like protein
MIDLYGCGSPNVLKILFMLGETGLPYTFHHVGLYSGELYSPEFLALNPNNRVPVIVDSEGPGGQAHTVFESGAILIYLAEKAGKLLPQDAATRSRALQWLMWQMAGVGPMFGQALHFKYIAPAGNAYAKKRYQTEVSRLYDVLERRLGEAAWLAGDEFSIADVASFPWAGKYVKTLEIDIARRPHVARWIAACEARPGYQAVRQLGSDLFRKDLENQRQGSGENLDRFFGRSAAARND